MLKSKPVQMMKLSASTKRLFSRLVLLFAPVAIIAALCLSSCKDQRPNTSGFILPDSNVSYTRDIDPLFAQTCLGSQCHSGSSPAQDLNLEPPSYSNLMNHVPRLVISGDPTSSLLAQRLDGTVPPVMPSNQNPLTANQIHGIKQWIKEGARFN
jgi:hypothetical protein